MMEPTDHRIAIGATIAFALLALSTSAVAQDADGTSTGSAASPQPAAISSTPPPDDVTAGGLPEPLGECGGAELRVLSVEAPFGEPLVPFEELLSRDGTSGNAEVEYLLPDGAVNAFISFSVPDADELSLQGSEILERNPEAPNINPDGRYSNATVQGTVPNPEIAQRTITTVDLAVVDEESYLGLWAGWGVDPADFVDPPYAHGDHLRVFIAFELDGANYSWSSRSSTTDCFVT